MKYLMLKRNVKMGMIVAVVTICFVSFLLTSCKTQIYHPMGTIEQPLSDDSVPKIVVAAMDKIDKDCYEVILQDTINHIEVWSMLKCSPEVSSEGYGILVFKDNQMTKMPDVYHGNNPLARYDADKGNLWLACGVMEGAGVHVERLSILRFNDEGMASVAFAIDPFMIQNAILQQLSYTIEDQQITFFDGERQLATATNSITDMGGFDDEQPVWIGENICYDISGEDVYVQFVPGVKFVTGLVLHYEDMPTLTARLNVKKDGSFDISDIECALWPFVGTYLDEDNREPNLHINYRRNDGKYDVQIGIFRLTSLDDGIAIMGDDGLEFTATDANGKPIFGLITLRMDTAIVTFTNSNWPLLENGSSFRYVRQPVEDVTTETE